jgi:thioredoxin 1
MSWPGYLTLAILALFGAYALWSVLATRQLRGRSVSELSELYPQLADHRGKAAIYCYSAHCGPCRSIAPAVDALAEERPNLFKLDIGAHPAAARRLGVQATPTTLLIEDGRVLKAVLGTHGLGAIKVFLGPA